MFEGDDIIKSTKCFPMLFSCIGNCSLVVQTQTLYFQLSFVLGWPPEDHKMETWFWILGWSLSILSMTGNGFIIFLVCRRWRLRNKTNAFVVSLAVADFCAGWSAFPPLFVCEEITGCDPTASGVDYFRWLFIYASVTNLSSLVLDRYIAIVRPLSYLTFMTRRSVFQMIFMSWTIPVVVVFAFLLNWLVFEEIV